jgi:Outer membrane protein beta-barrel domain
MKKLIFSAAMLIAAGFSVNAQDVKFGVKAGVNFSSLSGDVENADMLTGFHVGGLAEFKFGNFAIQPELLYTTAGAKNDYNDGFVSGDLTAKTSYIAVPVAAKYYILEGLSIQAGPQFAFLVSAKSKFEGSGLDEEADSKDLYKSFEFGVFGGVGYELESGLLFSARYVQGVSNIDDGEDSDDSKVQNTNIQLSVGYKF